MTVLCTAQDRQYAVSRYTHSRSSVNRVYDSKAGLDIMPKTTEQNRIVRTSKYEAEITNNKKTALEVLY